MRRILFFILPILFIVAAGFTVFGIIEVNGEHNRLMDELRRKARAVAESMELSVGNALETRNKRAADYLVERFQTRDRLQGCVIYDDTGKIVAITERFRDWQEKSKPYLSGVFKTKAATSGMEQFKDYTVYSFVLPVMRDTGELLGAVEIIYDTSYVFSRLTETWRRISVTLIVLFALIILASVVVLRHMFLLPVLRLTEWFRYFLKGGEDVDARHPLKDHDELGRLASEVEQVALSLRVARRAIVKEAEERVKTDGLWTEGKLRSLIQAKLGTRSMVVVSNREPFMHVADETGKVRCIRPASGVVTAIDPILRSLGGTWIAHGGGNADRRFVNSKDKIGVPPEDNRYILRRVWLSKEEEERYYYGFSNEGLWPLCHITHTRPVFHEEDWQSYQRVNQKFADAVIEELPAGPAFVFIQDYHFTLLPALIKARRPDVTVALFWHIPWPNLEVFSVCPYQKQILNGMLACDLIGFHVQYHCNNFLDTANRLLECRIDTERFSVVREQKETLVRAFPISIAPDGNAATQADLVERIRGEYKLDGKIVAVGVDRIDYTKGIAERIQAVDRFLEKYPEYRKKFVLLQVGAPSRTHIKRYHDLNGEIDGLVEKVNWKHSDGDYKPVIFIKRHFSQEEIALFYALGDICIVSSLHDGMNLVAKEYVMAKADGNGVLLLSCFTGAVREFADALAINPYATEDFAQALWKAATMPDDEKKRRMHAMRAIVQENNIYRWAASIVTELSGIRHEHEKLAAKPGGPAHRP